MKRILFSIFLASLGVILGTVEGKDYPIKLQPELDVLDVESYLTNPRLLNLQIKCILYDGPCDVVGRWAKPRVKAGLLGECILCTEKQKGWLETWLDRLIKNFPDLYRAGVAKFLTNSGVDVPADEVDKLKKTLAKLDSGDFSWGNSTTVATPSNSTTSTEESSTTATTTTPSS